MNWTKPSFLIPCRLFLRHHFSSTLSSWYGRKIMKKLTNQQKRLKQFKFVFWPNFGCAQHPKAGQNTQQLFHIKMQCLHFLKTLKYLEYKELIRFCKNEILTCYFLILDYFPLAVWSLSALKYRVSLWNHSLPKYYSL